MSVMNNKSIDWQVIKTSVVILIITIIILISASTAGNYYCEEQKKIYTREKNNLQAVRSSYLDIIEKNNIYAEYAKKFNQLKHKGVIGIENRLTWIEALQKTNEKLKLPLLNYTVSPQSKYDESIIGMDFFNVYVSKSIMTLQLGLLHEGDLFTLLNSLKNRARGFYLIDECQLLPAEKLPNKQNIDISKAIIQSNCSIHWVQVSLDLPVPAGEFQ